MSWVTRRLDADYGLDGEIEIFGDDGTATGLRLGLQLKGTDRSTLSVRLDMSTYRYLSALDYPVLLALYESQTGTVYARWLHSFRVYPNDDQKTITLRMDPEDRWGADTPDRLVAERINLRLWRDHDPPLPLVVKVSAADGLDISGSALARELIQELPGLTSLIAFSAADRDPHVNVLADAAAVEVNVLDMVSFRWTHRHGGDVQRAIRARSVALMIALVLHRSGKSQLAWRVLGGFDFTCPLLLDLSVAFATGAILASADGGIRQTLEAARRVVLLGQPAFHAARTIELGARISVGAVPTEDVTELQIRFYEDLIAIAPARGPLASAHYSLASIAFNAGRYALALHNYRHAAINNEAYRSRPYWWRETAASLFELGRYRLAECFYRNAVEMGTDLALGAVLGDSVLHQGRYREAMNLLEKHLEDNPDTESWWVLKAVFLESLDEAGMLSDQTRRPERALALAEVVDHESPSAIESRMLDALDNDMLCHPAWHNLAYACDELGDLNKARLAFLAAAATDLSCITCVVDAHRSHIGTEMAPLILAAAYPYHRAVLFQTLRSDIERVAGSLAPEVDDALERLEDELRREWKRREVPTIRITG